MFSVVERFAPGQSIALKLTLFYAFFFGLLASAGGVLLFQLVSVHVLGELDDDISRQKDEFVRMVTLRGDPANLAEEFRAYDESCGRMDCFIRMTDSNGNLLSTSDMSLWPGMPSPVQILPVNSGIISRFTTVDLPDYRHKARLLSVFIPLHGYLQLGVSLEESEALFSHFRRYGLMILGTMLSLGALIGWVLARNAMEGVSAVSRASRSVAAGNFSERVDVSGHGSEIDDLVRSFNLMVERVQTVMGEMRQVNDNIAHDLRSPLTRIRGLAESAAVSRDLHADGAALAGDIVEECDRLMQMINTMLDISEAEAGVGQLHIETVDLSELVAQAVDLFSGVAEDKGVSLGIGTSDGATEISADARKLQRVLANLIDNAIKYTPAGGQVRVNLKHEPGRVCIQVSDTGMGIAASDLPRVFERFYRCDESRHQAGSGLGLSLAQAIARAHGGGVAVDSRPGGGSVFSLILPA